MKVIIGIVPNINDEGVLSLDRAYLRAIERAGGAPVILPYVDKKEKISKWIDGCDGIMLTGGGDVAPKFYGEAPHPKTQKPCALRDELDFFCFNYAFEKKKPIFAICRGLQLANVALGGTLYQDLPSQFESKLCHKQTQGKFEPSHDVLVKEGTPLFDVVGKSKIASNSFHHQAVKVLADGLAVSAIAEDGLIEAVYHTGEGYFCGVQWHPERLCEIDGDNLELFKNFIKAASV